MVRILERAKMTLQEEKGQGLAEYGFVVLVVAIPVAGSVAAYSTVFTQLYSTIVGAFQQIM